MRPQTDGPWRKAQRRADRGLSRGRHRKPVETQPPREGSTWWRRHWWSVPTLDESTGDEPA